MRFISRLSFVAAFVLALAPLAGASAAVPPDVARALVVSLVDEAGLAFSAKDQTPEQQAAATLHLIDKFSNAEMVSKRILGHHWDRATTESQNTFKSLLASYVASARVPSPDAVESKDRLDIGDPEAVGERAVVHSTLVSPGEDPTPIDWVVTTATDGHPVIADIVSGGVSLVRTMKADFTAVIRSNNGDFGALLNAMRKKTRVAAPPPP